MKTKNDDEEEEDDEEDEEKNTIQIRLTSFDDELLFGIVELGIVLVI